MGICNEKRQGVQGLLIADREYRCQRKSDRLCDKRLPVKRDSNVSSNLPPCVYSSDISKPERVGRLEVLKVIYSKVA